MESLAVYLVKSVVGAGILFTFYVLALRGRKFHRYNRFYLLGTVLVSLLLPLINFRLYSFSFNLPEERNSINDAIFTRDIAGYAFSAREVVLFTCGVVSLVMIVRLLLKIMWVYRMVRNHEVQRMNGYYFIESGLKEAPFTFLDKLFWRKTISLNEDAGQKIFAHELAHIRQKHTYDKLFSQFVLCFFWMNPFYWFIHRELNIVHEFLADAKSIKEDDVASFAKMLLRSYNDGSYLDPVHPFFNSSVKRRLDMIARSGEPANNYIGRLAALPIVGLMVALFSFSLSDMELSDKTFYTQLIAPKMTEAVIQHDSIPVQKEDKHREEDKLAGVEKRAELQKSASGKKDKAQAPEKEFKGDVENPGVSEKKYLKPSATKESLKPSNTKGLKSAYFSAKPKNPIRKPQPDSR